MAVLHLNSDGPHLILDLPAHRPILDLSNSATVEEEIDAILAVMTSLDPAMPDQVIATCMALMGRATELLVVIGRSEATHRRLKVVRLSQLEPVMALIDFMFKGASRMVEIRRQEIDLSR